MKSVITGIFLPSWRFRGYTLQEKVNLWRGRAFSRSFGLWDQLISTDLRKTRSRAADPCVFPRRQVPLHLRHLASSETTSAQLQAPVKGFYVFDISAHSPLLEEPAEAHRILQEDVLAGTNGLADIR